jgi:Zn-dependent M28 family amino/carboxypeptidase
MLAWARSGALSKQAVEVSTGATSGSIVERPNDDLSTDFDGERAFAHVKTQVEFGPRPSGSAAIEKTREYIVRELKSYGLTTTLDQFTPVTPRGKTKMANIIAELPGESREVVMIASHYDTKYFKEFTFTGANDGGSSTGALLEIARVMAADKTQAEKTQADKAQAEKTQADKAQADKAGVTPGQQKRRYTYQFVFFDGEEAVCQEWSECLNGNDHTYGSRHLVEQLKKAKQLDRVKALVLLDMIGDADLAIPREENSSQWLVDAIWDTARKTGYVKHFPDRKHTITDDHLNFLQAGVPAVDLIDFDYGNDDRSYWHTKEDTLDKISAQSLKVVGDVILLSLPRIEAQIR